MQCSSYNLGKICPGTPYTIQGTNVDIRCIRRMKKHVLISNPATYVPGSCLSRSGMRRNMWIHISTLLVPPPMAAGIPAHWQSQYNRLRPSRWGRENSVCFLTRLARDHFSPQQRNIIINVNESKSEPFCSLPLTNATSRINAHLMMGGKKRDGMI